MSSDPPPAPKPNRKGNFAKGLERAREQAGRATTSFGAWLRQKAGPQSKKAAVFCGKKAVAAGRNLSALGRSSGIRLKSSLAGLKGRTEKKPTILQAELMVENDPVIPQPPIAEPPIAEPPIAEPPIAEPPIAEPPIAEPPIAEP
ncbi:MAG: hypothetical protein QGI77_13380, partial [Roseibacillus sp.]|nr:hypothetical protein [Roseibacillus sp.]